MICFGHAGQNPIIFSYVGFDASNVLQQIINTLLNLKWKNLSVQKPCVAGNLYFVAR
jgi:hypothetical protein